MLAASAPDGSAWANTSAKCWALPAPPEAISGIESSVRFLGVLTADARSPEAFRGLDARCLTAVAALAAAEMRTTQLIETLERTAERQGLIAGDLMRDAAFEDGLVVEVGPGAGVSGLWLLDGMREDGTLTTIDSEPEHQRYENESRPTEDRHRQVLAEERRHIGGDASDGVHVSPKGRDHRFAHPICPAFPCS